MVTDGAAICISILSLNGEHCTGYEPMLTLTSRNSAAGRGSFLRHRFSKRYL
jgi:hypothetical protein